MIDVIVTQSLAIHKVMNRPPDLDAQRVGQQPIERT
jgi:hypothetical protein